MTYCVWGRDGLVSEHHDLVAALGAAKKLARMTHRPHEVRDHRGVIMGACIPEGMSAREAMRQARRNNHDAVVSPVLREADTCDGQAAHDWIAYDRVQPQAYQCRMCAAWAERQAERPVRQRCSSCARWATGRAVGTGGAARWLCAHHAR